MLPLLNASGYICKIKNTIFKKTNIMQAVVFKIEGKTASSACVTPLQANLKINKRVLYCATKGMQNFPNAHTVN